MVNSIGASPRTGIDNFDIALHLMAKGESDFDEGAHGDKDVGGSHGAFQFHNGENSTLEEAKKLTGMDPSTGSLQEQAEATLKYIEMAMPETFAAIGSAQSNEDWDTVIGMLGEKWYSLPGQKSDKIWSSAEGQQLKEEYLSGNFEAKFDVTA